MPTFLSNADLKSTDHAVDLLCCDFGSGVGITVAPAALVESSAFSSLDSSQFDRSGLLVVLDGNPLVGQTNG